ncbi:Acyl transferase/acyl hydrolase/lysophospholipase [Penicillium expansum]|nr:Acyl transferase/acyl hydrolase/lysophospholipase [Penicillium expansum]
MSKSNIVPPTGGGTLYLGSETPILAVWGGVGFTRLPLKDLRDLYALHKDDLEEFLQRCSQTMRSFASDEGERSTDNVQQDLMEWITDSSRRLPPGHALPAEVSGVVTAILQISRYIDSGEMAQSFSAFSGHSVGIVVAAWMAVADSWSSLYDLTNVVMSDIYYGIRQASTIWDQGARVSQSMTTECVRRGEGAPSSMLSVTGLERSKITKAIDEMNIILPEGRTVHLALLNDVDSFVIAGSPEGLVALASRLRTSQSPDVGEANTPLSDRQPRCSLQFVPSHLPFHSPLLQKAATEIRKKPNQHRLRRDQIRVPVWGLDSLLEKDPSLADNLEHCLVEMSLSQPVDWPKTLEPMTGRWQVLDFGPGGSNGIGMVINKMKPGTQTKIYTVCPAERWRTRTQDSPSANLISTLSIGPTSRQYSNVEFVASEISRQEPSNERVASRFMHAMGLPNILVAGMTPTTCDPGLVAAIMNAGFYAELATGGYHDAPSLENAVWALAKSIPPGRLITVNVVYANPQGLSWMIPLLASLVRKGCPIGGLVIGAGVPSAEIAAEYIKVLELSYIGFKPASASAIYQVLEIAKSHPTLPILLQWTGGRAGGHHSFEDFHRPILETYHAICEVSNVLLVAGSGFGDADGSWPYISGGVFGREPMPFDAILLGTCIMTTLEAKTSHDAKQALVNARGVADAEWPSTLKGCTGGVISVISHLGEPMHVLATRGMRLWAELDKTLFTLPKDKMITALHSRREYLISRLNDDYQKVWFGFDYVSNKAVDLADMTYFDVLRRLLELLHPDTRGDWTFPSYQKIFNAFLERIMERFGGVPLDSSITPQEKLDAVASAIPHLAFHFLSLEDTHYFVDLCQQKRQKPVPFIPVLDLEFPVWFKKDPLWQSENLDATYHRDAGRVCILCGPVAVQHCKEANLPVSALLRQIHHGYLAKGPRLTPPAAWLDDKHDLSHALEALHVNLTDDVIQHPDRSLDAVSSERWLLLLGSQLGEWGRRLFGAQKLVSHGQSYENPVRRIFSARPGILVRLLEKAKDGYCGAEICDRATGLVDARVSINGSTITAAILVRCSLGGHLRELSFQFLYDPSCSYAPIVEITEGRTQRILDFYHSVLFGPTMIRSKEVKPHFMQHSSLTVSKSHVLAWMRAVDGRELDAADPLGPNGEVPIEYATILTLMDQWRHLFTWDWDISKLLHQRTMVEMREGHRMLAVGDEVRVTTQIRALHNRDSGIEVVFDVKYEREGARIMDCIQQIMMLGQRAAESDCSDSGEPTTWILPLRSESDVQAIQAKPWFSFIDGNESLNVGQTLIFEIKRETRLQDGSSVASTTGDVWLQEPKHLCGKVKLMCKATHPDVVADFMKREASRTGEPLRLPPQTGMTFQINPPDNSIEYAVAGGDYNPIHTIPTFSRFSGFEVPVYHGNHTIALVLQLIRREIPGANVMTLRKYDVTFSAVVFPREKLTVLVKHVAMDEGRIILSISAQREGSEETVLAAEVVLDPPTTTLLFTGQGSQFQGMGLDMIAESRACRRVWAEADAYFEHDWGLLPLSAISALLTEIMKTGFSITQIVKNNPKQTTVNFCGKLGMQSRSYTFFKEDGLLSMTQFAQPAIFVLEKAAFEYLKEQGRVSLNSHFAGHSLGEFAALGSMTSIMSATAALKAVFIRGALMQAATPRDALGRSAFAMMAVDPTRVGKDDAAECSEEQILRIIDQIVNRTGLPLQMVNFNIKGHQYVCAGDKRCLELLQRVTDELHHDKSDLDCSEILVAKYASKIAASANGVSLSRGTATVPLKGIDVPFHSSLLAPMRGIFRTILADCVDKSEVQPEVLVGKWIPNVTGKPFALDDAYVKLVSEMTSSV